MYILFHHLILKGSIKIRQLLSYHCTELSTSEHRYRGADGAGDGPEVSPAALLPNWQQTLGYCACISSTAPEQHSLPGLSSATQNGGEAPGSSLCSQ